MPFTLDLSKFDWPDLISLARAALDEGHRRTSHGGQSEDLANIMAAVNEASVRALQSAWRQDHSDGEG